jgi:hypothetical protein
VSRPPIGGLAPVLRPHALLRPRWRRSRRPACALAAVLVLAPAARAQELEPRAYSNLPIGLNFLALGYVHSQGGLATDPSLPLDDAHLTIHSGVFAYVRSLDFWGSSGKFDVIVPYSRLSGSALVAGQPATREVSGFGDPRLRLAVNFYGAPSLALPAYSRYRPDLVVGASVQVAPPLGQYDPSRAVNLGTNRWAVKPDIGFAKTLAPFTFDLTAGVTLFTRNDNYFGGKKVDQAPLYSTQANLSYDFGSGIWAAFGVTYYEGGRTTLDGVARDDSLSNSRFGLTVAVPIDRAYAVKLNASSGISTRTGTSFDSIGVVLQYRWGGGL